MHTLNLGNMIQRKSLIVKPKMARKYVLDDKLKVQVCFPKLIKWMCDSYLS